MPDVAIDYAALIKRVLADKSAMHEARRCWFVHAANILDDRPRTAGKLRVSDAGACSLSLWAEIHGKLDIGENYQTLDSRMQPGQLDGARTACLIAAGIKCFYWPLTVQLEQLLDHELVPGHADIIVYAEPDPIEVVECKLTLYGKGIKPPEEEHRYWIYQACLYAMHVGAPTFVVLVHAPAAWSGPSRAAFRYYTDDWRLETVEEYARLAQAMRDDPPEADPPQDWRCKSCRYSQCERNVNPLRPVVERIVDEVLL